MAQFPCRARVVWFLATCLWASALSSSSEAAIVQSGTASIADGSATTTATITAVDLDTSFLVFSLTGSDANPNNIQVTGRITNSTTLTFARIGTSGAMSIAWYVAEFTTGATVQRGTLSPMTGTTSNVTISSVDTARAMPVVTYAKAGSDFGANDYVKAKLTSATNLEITRVGGSDGTVDWQVVEFTSAAVQTGDVAFGSGDASTAAAVTAVDTTKSWLVYSYSSDGGTAADIGQKLVRGVVTNATTLTFDRDNTGQALDLTWYLVEFTDATTVQHGSEAFGGAETQRDVTLPTAVDLSATFAVGGVQGRGGKSPYAATDNPGVGWVTAALTTTTNLQLTRGLSGSTTADVGWFVVHLGNDAPTISDIANQSTTDGVATSAIAFTVGDLESTPASLTVSGSSSDQTLVPNASITFGGSGASRTVTVTPAAGQEGTATITVTVSDGTATATDTFTLTVGPANGAPMISDIDDMSVRRWDPTDPIAFVIADAETAATSLTVSGSSSNQGLVRNADLVFGGSGANRTLVITPVGNTGTGTITITVSDGVNDTTETFQLTVDEPPTITAIADQVTEEDTPTGAIAFTIGDVESNVADLVLTGYSVDPLIVMDDGIVFGGSGANRTVTVTPVGNAFGATAIWVIVDDGTEHTIAAFDLTVTAVNDAPSVTSISDQTVNEDTPTTALGFEISDPESAAASLTVSGVSSDQVLVPNANIVIAGSGEERTVVVTPALNQGGYTTITISVGDGTLVGTTSFQLTVIPDKDVTLTLTGNGAGSVQTTTGLTCTASCMAEFPNGTVVALAAAPGAGSVFAGWGGAEDCRDGVLSEQGNVACTARFTLQTVVTRSAKVDFNGDDLSDVFWYQEDTGSWGVETTDVDSFSSVRGTWDAGATVIPLDFDGNGLTDLLRYDATTGVWFQEVNLGNGTFASFGGAWDPGWGVLGMELDGDGRSDVFLYNATTGVWSACVTGSGPAQFDCHGGPYSMGWRVTRLSLDDDSLDDLFIHHPSTGHWFQFVNDGAGGLLEQGGAPLRGRVMRSDWLRSNAWTLRPADLDGNGRSDLLFYRPDSGQWAEGLAVGESFDFHGGQWLAGWSVAAGNLNGDANADAFLYDPASGHVMQAANIGLGFELTEAGMWTPDWSLHPASFNADTLLDVLLYNDMTGQWFAAVRTDDGQFAYRDGVWPAGVRITTELPAELR